MSFANKVTPGTYNFVFLIVKIKLLELAVAWSTPAANKTQYFVKLNFNSTLQFINNISRDFKKLLTYFHGMATVIFSRMLLLPEAAVVPNNLALHLKDLQLSLFPISVLKLVASSLE